MSVITIDEDTGTISCDRTYEEFKAYYEEYKDNGNEVPYKNIYIDRFFWGITGLITEDIQEDYENVPDNVTEGFYLELHLFANDGNFYMQKVI